MSDTIGINVTATDAGFSATFDKMQAKVNEFASAHVKKAEAFARTEQMTVKALELEAAGHTKAAAAMRTRIEMMERAAKISARTGLSGTEALAMAGRRMSAEREIAAAAAGEAAQKARGKPGLPLMALTPGYVKDMERATAQTRELARWSYRAGHGGMAGSMGFLAFSQAVEDAQYGMRGVLNNIPQMVMGFGGTMGLAGALSLAAVAAFNLYPLIKKLTGASKDEQFRAGIDAYKKSWEAALKSIQEKTAERNRKEALERAKAKNQQNIESDFAVNSTRLVMLDAQIEKQNELRASSQETSEQELARLKKTADLNRMASRAAAEEADRLNLAYQSSRRYLRDEIEGTNARLLKEEMMKARAEATVAETMARRGNKWGDRSRQNVERMRDAERFAAKHAAAIETLKDRLELLSESQEKTDATAKRSLDTINKTIRDRWNEANAIDNQIKKERELLRVKQQQQNLERTLKYDQEQRQRAEAFTREKEAAAERVKERAKMDERRADFAAGIVADRLRMQGRDAMASALEKEISMRREASDLAEELGIHEQHALRLIRLRGEAMERAERGTTAAPRRDRLGFGASRLAGREGFTTGSLRAAEIERRAERAANNASRDRKDSAAAYWERQLDLQQKLVDHFAKLGVI